MDRPLVEVQPNDEEKRRMTVSLMTNILTFLTQMQDVCRDIKLNPKPDATCKKVLQMFTRLQNSHSRTNDVLQSVRKLRNDLSGTVEEQEDLTKVGSTGGTELRPKFRKANADQESQRPMEASELEAKCASLSEQVKRLEKDLKKKNEYISWITLKNQQLASKSGGESGAATPDNQHESMVLPQHIVNDYNSILGKEWKQAFKELDSRNDVPLADSHQFLYYVMMVCQRETRGVYDKLFQDLKSPLYRVKYPFKDFAEPEHVKGKTSKAETKAKSEVDMSDDFIPLAVKTHCENTLRSNCASVDLEGAIKLVKKTLSEKPKFVDDYVICKQLQSMVQQGTYTDTLNDFITKFVQLTWKMTTQMPRFYLRQYSEIGSKFEEKLHELYEGSGDPKNFPIAHFVHPCLTRGMNPAKLVNKAKVFCCDTGKTKK